jgi:ABC-2 type transport system ATP-binding protein
MVTSAMTEDKIFIISTHQVHDVENLIDPIIILDEGKIILNATLSDISKILLFEHYHILPKEMSPLHVKKTIDGYLTVDINKTNRETDIHIESLFNTVISNKNMIRRLFKELQDE